MGVPPKIIQSYPFSICRLPLDDVAFATVIDATVSGGVTWRVALQLLQEEQELRIQVP